MPITIVCPGCNAKLKAPDNLIGKAVKCPTCSKPVLVKAPGAAAPPAAPPAPVKKPVRQPEPILEEEPLEEEEIDPIEDELDSPPVKKKKKGDSAGELAGGPSTDKERSTAMWIYFLPYALICCGGIGTFVSLFLWISKRKESPFIDYHGKNWLNLLINSFVLAMPLSILGGIGGGVVGLDSTVGMVIMGFFVFLAFLVIMYFFVMMVLSGLKAKKGEWYQAKMAFRVLK